MLQTSISSTQAYSDSAPTTSSILDESTDSNTVLRDRPWGTGSSFPSITLTISAPTSALPTPSRTATPLPTTVHGSVPTVEQSSSDPSSRGSSRPVDQQFVQPPGRLCRLQSVQDPLSVITIAVTSLGLLLCLAFLRRSWRYWRTRRAPVELGDRSDSPVIDPKPALSSPSLGFDRPSPSPIRRGSAATTSESSKRPSEATLVLAAWILFTLDHLSLLGMLIALFYVCPQYNCWHKPPAHTPGCPVPELFLLWHVMLSLGASVFVLATLQRFVRVYALLSHKRYILLCFCTLLVVVVLVGRLSAISFHTFVRLAPYSTWPVNSPMRKLAGRVNRISYLAYFFILAVLALAALLIGLQFVLNVRANLVRIHRHAASPTSPAFATGIASPIATPVLSTTLIYGHSSEPCDDHLYHRAQSRIRRRRWIVIGWILVSIFMLCNFGAVALVPKDEIPVPVNLFNALLLLLVKALVAAVSMAMGEVVKLATARDSDNGGGGQHRQ